MSISMPPKAEHKPNIILLGITRILFYLILIIAGYIIGKFQILLTTF